MQHYPLPIPTLDPRDPLPTFKLALTNPLHFSSRLARVLFFYFCPGRSGLSGPEPGTGSLTGTLGIPDRSWDLELVRATDTDHLGLPQHCEGRVGGGGGNGKPNPVSKDTRKGREGEGNRVCTVGYCRGGMGARLEEWSNGEGECRR